MSARRCPSWQTRTVKALGRPGRAPHRRSCWPRQVRAGRLHKEVPQGVRLQRGACGAGTCNSCLPAAEAPSSRQPTELVQPWQGQTRQRRKRKQARAGPGMRARARARSGAATFLMTSAAARRPRRIGTFLDKGMGYVLVDVRPSGEVDPRVQMTLQMLVFAHNVRAARWVRLRRGSGAALWVSASMAAKVPPLVHELATVRSLPEGVNALIGKAYALLHSPFNISVRLSPQVDVPTPQHHGTAHPRRCSSTATAGSAQTGGPSCRRPLLLRPRHALFLRYTDRPRRHHALCSSSSPRAASPTSRRRHQP